MSMPSAISRRLARHRGAVNPLISRYQTFATQSARLRDPWIVEATEANHQDLAAESISKHGFVILKDLFDADELKKLTSPASLKTEEVMKMLKMKNITLGIGSRAGFREVCLRSPGRYDVPCNFDEFPSELLERIETIASQVLVTDAGPPSTGAPTLGRAFAGLVRASPKSEAQIWHADSPHSTAQHTSPHLLNVLVPSVTVTEEMGPTELVPGSHLLTNHLRQDAEFGTEILGFFYIKPYRHPNNTYWGLVFGRCLDGTFLGGPNTKPQQVFGCVGKVSFYFVPE